MNTANANDTYLADHARLVSLTKKIVDRALQTHHNVATHFIVAELLKCETIKKKYGGFLSYRLKNFVSNAAKRNAFPNLVYVRGRHDGFQDAREFLALKMEKSIKKNAKHHMPSNLPVNVQSAIEVIVSAGFKVSISR